MIQLAEDELENYPKGAAAIRRNRYADDFYVGEDSLEELLDTRRQLISILASAGMRVSKWAANQAAILQDLQPTDKSEDTSVAHDSEAVSTLGIRWNSVKDYFYFRIVEGNTSNRVTKRNILSDIATLFDPIGYVSPVTIRAKILLQNLWLLKLSWDEPVPEPVAKAWIDFKSQLPALQHFQIPRWVGMYKKAKWSLHGFCDASERAYAAVLFVVVDGESSNKYSSRFLTAKAKVAPVKAVSLPRLELCGAHLLSRLISHVLPKLDLEPSQIFCWTDSRIVLAWLQSHASRWKTFIANRVSAITTAIPTAVWRHVASHDNPADVGSRGISPHGLKEFSLWWQGPSWLQQPSCDWPLAADSYYTSLEARSSAAHVFVAQQPTDEFVLWTMRFSSAEKIIRILAYFHRWRLNSKLNPSQRRLSWLSAVELALGQNSLFRGIQKFAFSREIHALTAGKRLPSNSPILRLVPFLDDHGNLRVGGRLQNAFLTEDEKHPVILPAKNHVTQLLILHAHQDTLHGGPSLVQSHLARKFWIVRGRSVIRSIIRRCSVCARDDGVPLQQQMGPLPEVRTRPSRPFSSTGVDYAGPFLLKWSPGRGQKSVKAYVAIFVCMVVRAIHIEVVSDLSTAAFLAAFKRFVGRRGLPRTMFSDNGTAFQGASAELRRLFVKTSRFSQDVAERVARDGVTWTFIPPRAPNFGGLWEANVRSFKKHLRRVVGDQRLTYEEFSTVCVTIEACLNSRPLSAVSTHEQDLFALTPGHFLIGAALTAPPEPAPETPHNSSVCSRWKMINLMMQHFWMRWQQEFLTQMQRRSKWLYPNRAFKVGDLVLFKDELLPATKWPLARIVCLYPGKDGLARVARIKSGSKEFTRPINKLILLPINGDAVHQHRVGGSTAGGSAS